MKKIFMITLSVFMIILLTGCGKTNEEIEKEFEDKVSNTLMDYSLQIYNNEQYLNYKISDTEYYISLKDLKDLGYDTTMFIKPTNQTECDIEKTGITITIVDGSFSSSFSSLCK